MRLTLPKLLAYLDGALPAAERGAVEACIEHDPQARALLARARRMLEDPAREETPPPSSHGGPPPKNARDSDPRPAEHDDEADSEAESSTLSLAAARDGARRRGSRREAAFSAAPRAESAARPAARLFVADDDRDDEDDREPGRSSRRDDLDSFDDYDAPNASPLVPDAAGGGGWGWAWLAGAAIAGVAAWNFWPTAQPPSPSIGPELAAQASPAAKGVSTAPDASEASAAAPAVGERAAPAAAAPTASNRVAGVYPQPWEYPRTGEPDAPPTAPQAGAAPSSNPAAISPSTTPSASSATAPSATAPAASGAGMPAPSAAMVADPQTQRASLQQPAAFGPGGAGPDHAGAGDDGSGETIGMMISSQYPLLRYAPQHSTWKLVAAEERVQRGAMLLSPPHAQPSVALDEGLLLEMLPGTSLELPASDSAPAQLFLLVHFGRVRITARKPMQTLLVCLDGETVPVVFPHAGAMLALEAAPVRGEGGDPRIDGVRQQLHFAALREELQLAFDRQERILAAPEQLLFDSFDKRWKSVDEALPTWALAPPQSSMDDLRAQKLLVEALLSKLPPEQSLPRMAQDERPAVRVGAARWLGLMGEYGALASLLNDPQLSPLQRQQVVDELLDGMARGPGWVEHVDQALRLQYGRRGAELFRMLQGAADEGKLQEAREVWTPALDDDLLAARTLAFHQLRRLTGAPYHYRPEMSASVRRPLVQRFRDRVERMGGAEHAAAP